MRAVHIVEQREGRVQTKNPRQRAAEEYEFDERQDARAEVGLYVRFAREHKAGGGA